MTKPLTDAINALTTYANSVTGASDTDLSSAVATLANGYGQGGGGWTTDGIVSRTEPSGDITVTASTIKANTLRSVPITSLSGTCTTIEDYSIYQCPNLLTVSLPNVTSALTYALAENRAMTSLSVPNLTDVPSYFAFNARALQTLNIRNAVTIANRAFQNCYPLANVDTKTTSIGANAFESCTSLNVIILRHTAVATLANISAFNNTPFASGKAGGTLYVPSALISSYQSATNWSTILGYANNSIQAIEGSQYENYYADGTSIE